ncbi:MAG: extracellular solute-binding protein [Lachnospiraceae bacterium]
MRPYIQRIIAALLVLLVLSQMITYGFSHRDTKKEQIDSSSEKAELTIWYTDAKLNDFMILAAEDYEKKTGVAVNVQLISAVDYIEKISEATFIEEAGPDLFVAGSDLLQKALYAGLVDEQVAYTEEERANIPDKAFRAATCDGKLTGYPFYYESCFLLYNKNYASDWPRNIDEILEYADTFESNEETSRVESIFKWDVSDIFYNYFFIGEYVNLGGPYGDDKAQLDLSEGKVLECLEYYQSLNSFFAIDAKTVHSEDVLQQFIDGKIVFTIAKTDAIERLEEAVGEGERFYGIGDVPNLSSELLTRGLSVTNSIVVNNYSKNSGIANDFAHYLSYERADGLYKQTGKVSVCRSVNAGNEDWERIMGQYEGSVEIPKIIEMSNYWILMEIAFANIWNGADISEEVVQVVSQVNMQLSE